MNSDPFLIAIGLTIWTGVFVAAAIYVSWRLRIPTTRPGADAPIALKVIGAFIGFAIWAIIAFYAPGHALVFNLIASVLIPYGLVAFAVALTVERRRAKRLGLAEPGTDGTVSVAQSVVFLAIAAPFAVAALFLTVYGVANEFGGNSKEGLAGLGLGACAWFMAIWMTLFGLPMLLKLRRFSS